MLGFVLGGDGVKEVPSIGCFGLFFVAVIWIGSGWLVLEAIIQIIKHLRFVWG